MKTCLEEPSTAPDDAAEPESVAGSPPALTVIEPPAGWQLINARELWRFRELAYFLAWRDVKVRYKQTALGAAWALLQPALMMVVFTLFFNRMGGIGSGDVPYPLFAYAGLLPWTFFATAIAAAGSSVVGSERLITKIYFPRLTIPFAAVGASVVDFAIGLGLLGVLLLAYGVRPGPGLLLLPPIFGLIALAALGVGSALAALNVAYRDVRYAIPFLIQVWMFATPTIYIPDVARGDRPGWLGAVVAANPLSGLVGAFRAAALGEPLPWMRLAVAAALAAACFVTGCLYYRRVEDRFSDII